MRLKFETIADKYAVISLETKDKKRVSAHVEYSWLETLCNLLVKNKHFYKRNFDYTSASYFYMHKRDDYVYIETQNKSKKLNYSMCADTFLYHLQSFLTCKMLPGKHYSVTIIEDKLCGQ